MEKEIKNLKKAAQRILKAVQKKEKIILLGDADPDGACSVVILKEALDILGNPPTKVYFPDREEDGYGINEIALKSLKSLAPALLIVLDFGISNAKEVEIAKKLGFETVIIDHHEPLSLLPLASVIVDPKQKSDSYPFKELACAGVAFKLVKVLLSLGGKDYEIEKFLELATIGTLTDQMPLVKENRDIVKKGILALNLTQRKGLQALMKLTEFEPENGLAEIKEKLLPPLNSSGLEDHLDRTYLLLTENSFQNAQILAEDLIRRSKKKRGEIARIFQEAEKMALKNQGAVVIFEGDQSWPLVLLGPVASRMCQRHKKPCFLFSRGKKESPGSVRVPSGMNAVKAMSSCPDLFKIYGGHPLAAGFRLKNENLKKFKECLIKYFSK